MSYVEKIVSITASKTSQISSLDLLGKICIVSLGESSISQNTMKEVFISSYEKDLTPTGDLKKVLSSFFSLAKEYSINVLELGSVDSGSNTIDTKIAKLKSLLEQGDIQNYIYLMPKQFLASDSMVSLCSAYNSINESVYFAFPISKDTDIESDSTIPKYNNLKSVLLVYNQLTDTENNNILGIFGASYIVNFSKINSSNNMRSFDYLYINLNVDFINAVLTNQLKAKNIIYFMPLTGKPSYMNVKTQDGENFVSSIAYDNLKLRLSDRIVNTLVGNANKFNSSIPYSDNGIKILKSVIEEELETNQNLKIIQEFGAVYNDSEKAIENKNEISYIPFQQYIKDNPADYQDNAYNGFLTNIRLAKFILTLDLKINIA